MKLKNHVSIYITSVLVLTTILIANNYINKSKVPSTPTKNISQQALNNTSTIKNTDATQTKTAASTTTNTTVKPSTKTSTVSTPKTTVKASTTTPATVPTTETPTEPTLTEQERVYKFAHIDASKISSNSPYTVTIDKTSIPDLSNIYIQVSPLERWAASITTVQAFSDEKTLMGGAPMGGWIMNPDGKTYSNAYKGNIGVAFNGASKMNLYIFIKEKNGTIYQHKFAISKLN